MLELYIQGLLLASAEAPHCWIAAETPQSPCCTDGEDPQAASQCMSASVVRHSKDQATLQTHYAPLVLLMG